MMAEGIHDVLTLFMRLLYLCHTRYYVDAARLNSHNLLQVIAASIEVDATPKGVWRVSSNPATDKAGRR